MRLLFWGDGAITQKRVPHKLRSVHRGEQEVTFVANIKAFAIRHSEALHFVGLNIDAATAINGSTCTNQDIMYIIMPIYNDLIFTVKSEVVPALN
jgi:hypothetical protein